MNTRVKTTAVAPGLYPLLIITALFSALLLASAAEPKPDGPATADAAAAAEEEAAKLLELFESDANITNSLNMVMVHVPQGYRVAQYEITQAQYQALMGSNPSKFPGPQRPVEQVTWSSAKAFCEKLTEKDREAGIIPPGYAYALPTESQWEHYVDQARIEDSITSHLGDRRNTENVGGLPPNQYGLYDTRGNVWEWCASPVARGGSWRSHEDYLEINFRYTGDPNLKFDDIGFRVVLQSSTKP